MSSATEPGIYLCLGTVGLIAAAVAPRIRANVGWALTLAIAAVLCVLSTMPTGQFAIGRWGGEQLTKLVLYFVALGAPLALGYGFHVRRHSSDRDLAWMSFILSVLTFPFFVLLMIASAMNFGAAMGWWR